MADSTKLSEIIKTSLENAKNVADVNTVVGREITTANGTVIIPISKVSVGLASGGVDFFGKNTDAKDAKNSNQNFGGGGGTGISVSPVGFLVIKPSGEVEMLNIDAPAVTPAASSVDSIIGAIEKSPDIIQRLKEVFTSKKKSEAPADTVADAMGDAVTE